MGVALFVAGFAIAPTLIATMTAVEQTVPARGSPRASRSCTPGWRPGSRPARPSPAW